MEVTFLNNPQYRQSVIDQKFKRSDNTPSTESSSWDARIGVVVGVDTFKGVCQVKWITDRGGLDGVKYVGNAGSSRAFGGYVPLPGSVVQVSMSGHPSKAYKGAWISGYVSADNILAAYGDLAHEYDWWPFNQASLFPLYRRDIPGAYMWRSDHGGTIRLSDGLKYRGEHASRYWDQTFLHRTFESQASALIDRGGLITWEGLQFRREKGAYESPDEVASFFKKDYYITKNATTADHLIDDWLTHLDTAGPALIPAKVESVWESASFDLLKDQFGHDSFYPELKDTDRTEVPLVNRILGAYSPTAQDDTTYGVWPVPELFDRTFTATDDGSISAEQWRDFHDVTEEQPGDFSQDVVAAGHVAGLTQTTKWFDVFTKIGKRVAKWGKDSLARSFELLTEGGIWAKIGKDQNNTSVTANTEGNVYIAITGSDLTTRTFNTKAVHLSIKTASGAEVIVDEDGNIIFENTGDIQFKYGGNLEMTDGANGHVLAAEDFLTAFDQHIHPTGVGPSGVPAILLSPQIALLTSPTVFIDRP